MTGRSGRLQAGSVPLSLASGEHSVVASFGAPLWPAADMMRLVVLEPSFLTRDRHNAVVAAGCRLEPFFSLL